MTDEPPFVAVRQVVLSDGDDRALRRGAERGELVRLHRGAYIAADLWRDLEPWRRYPVRVRAAAAAMRNEVVLAQQSAAAIWGIPLLGVDPPQVHVLSTPSTGTRIEGGVHRHASTFLDDEIAVVDGLTVTGFERTLVDLARVLEFPAAVAAFDWAYAPTSRSAPKPQTSPERVLAVADRLGVVRGARRLRRVVEFADGRSGSAGESESRAQIHLAGFPRPELQHRFSDGDGPIGRGDFWWEEWLTLGEFDGMVKYRANAFGNGHAVERIVVDEKVREDRIRATGPRVVRWITAELRPPGPMIAKLRAAGLPQFPRSRGLSG